jgi:hypothetical protein
MPYDAPLGVPVEPSEEGKASHQALLDAIEKMAPAETNSLGLLYLAEAWAWLMHPNMSHGGGTAHQ